MLIDYKDLVQKYGWNPKGVIHVGGHRGEEQEVYDALNVKRTIWFEAIPESAIQMMEKFEKRKDVFVVKYALSDVTGKSIFYETNNGASSSILPLGTHETRYPKIQVKNTYEVDTIRLDEFLTHTSDQYDTLNIDVQGAELKVLKGAGDLLHQIKWIYCEVNIEHVYENCALIDEIDDYLKDYGFERVETCMTPKGWGDAFYVKR